MGAQITGLIQGIRYGSDTEKLYFRLMQAGADVTSVKATTTPTVTIYNPDGDVVLTATNLTQVGSTGWWYYTLDASATATWEIGYGYRAQIDWIDTSSLDQRMNVLLDVVADPFNDPVITTSQFDDEHPDWDDARATGWTDWTKAILIAHLELARDLRDLKDNTGTLVYPSRIIDRGALERVEMAYAERVAVMQGMRADESMQKHYCAKAVAAFKGLSTLDLHDTDDDDLEDGSEAYIGGPQFER